MRKLMFCLFALVVAMSATAQEKKIVEFEERTHDFGTVDEAGQITYVFTFTNTNATPISISKVKASCGCTTPNWNKAPIAPGETGEVKVSYNTKNRPGMFQKSITITLSDGQQEFTEGVYINGDVIAAPKPTQETNLNRLKVSVEKR